MIEGIIPELYATTDYKAVIDLPNTISNLIPRASLAGTISGSSWNINYLTIFNDQELFKRAVRILGEIDDQEVKKESRELIAQIIDIIHRLRNQGRDFSNLPSFNVEKEEDGSILFEWIFANFRIGFTTEKKHEESGWYLVSNENMGNINAFGNFIRNSKETIIAWLLIFALSNN